MRTGPMSSVISYLNHTAHMLSIHSVLPSYVKTLFTHLYSAPSALPHTHPETSPSMSVLAPTLTFDIEQRVYSYQKRKSNGI